MKTLFPLLCSILATFGVIVGLAGVLIGANNKKTKWLLLLACAVSLAWAVTGLAVAGNIPVGHSFRTDLIGGSVMPAFATSILCAVGFLDGLVSK